MNYTQEDLVLVKISTALQYCDELEYLNTQGEVEYYRSKFKRDTERFIRDFHAHTKDVVKVRSDKNPELWDVFTIQFPLLIEGKIKGATEELRYILIMLSLFRSAVKDIKSYKKKDFKFGMLCGPIRSRLEPLVGKKYLRSLPLPPAAFDNVMSHINKLYNETNQ